MMRLCIAVAVIALASIGCTKDPHLNGEEAGEEHGASESQADAADPTGGANGGTEESAVEPSPVPNTASAVAEAPQPACQVELRDGHIYVAKTRLEIATIDLEDYLVEPSIATYAFGENQVLFAVAPNWHVQGGAGAPGELYRTSCSGTGHGNVDVVQTIEGADFGNAVQSRDGLRLFFGGHDGTHVADLTTGSTRQITKTVPYFEDECMAAGDTPARDLVLGLSPDESTLYVERGGPCGYEGDWVSNALEISIDPLPDAPLDPNSDALRVPHPVSSLALDAGGSVWLADGGRCEEPGLSDRRSRAVVYRSDDGGLTWSPVSFEVNDDADVDYNAPVYLVADPKAAGHVALVTGVCESAAATIGGSLFLTRDGGKTWVAPTIPEELAEPRDMGFGITGLWLDGDLDHLIVEVADGVRLVTDDGGRTWKPKKVDPAPHERRRVELTDGAVLAIDPRHGVNRIVGDASTSVFPGTAWFERELQRFLLAPRLELDLTDARRDELELHLECDADDEYPICFREPVEFITADDAVDWSRVMSRDHDVADPFGAIAGPESWTCSTDGCCEASPQAAVPPEGFALRKVCMVDDGTRARLRSIHLSRRSQE